MLDIVSSGDNLQEKSKLYLLEKYEKCFAVFPHISMYPSQSKATKGSNSSYENYKNVNKIIIIPKKFFQTWTYYLFIYYFTVYMSKFTQIMVLLII